jgi:putative transferase (TIGR04331 family)
MDCKVVSLTDLGRDISGAKRVGLGPWVEADNAVVTEPAFTRREAHDASQALKEVVEAVLPKLASALNDIHDVNRSVRYWSIVLDLSVHRLLSMVCERFQLVKQCRREINDGRFVTLAEDCFRPVGSFENVMSLSGENDRFNWQLFSQCIRAEGIPHVEQKHPLSGEGGLSIENTERSGLRRMVDHRNRGIRSSVAYSGLRISVRREKAKFLVYTRGRAWQVRNFPICVKGQGFYKDIDVEARDRIGQIRLQSTGGLLPSGIGGILKHNLPAIFVEGFDEMTNQVRGGIARNGVPDLIFTGPMGHDVSFRAWVAECVQRGAKLFGVQHGSGYGDVPEDAREAHERQVADRFLTWGWRRREKDYPLSVPRFSGTRRKRAKNSRRDGLLWVTLGGTAYIRHKYPLWLRWYQLGGSAGFEPDHSHRRDCFRALDERILSETTVRFKGKNPKVKERVQRVFEGGRIDSHGTLLEQARNARLVVVDHYPSTSLYELIHADIPVVVVDDIPEWYLDGAATDVLWDLVECGILQRSAESAASLLNEIYSRVGEWWKEPERQAIIRRARHHHARRAKSPMWEYASFANQHLD